MYVTSHVYFATLNQMHAFHIRRPRAICSYVNIFLFYKRFALQSLSDDEYSMRTRALLLVADVYS